MNGLRVAVFLAASLWTVPAGADDFDMTVIGRPEIVRPHGAPTAATAIFSGASGWGETERALAKKLTAQGSVVIGVDTPATLARMAKAGEDCVWVIGEIEAVSHAAQRELDGAAYHFPALTGIEIGGTFALAVAAQTEVATIDRVVTVDPEAALPGTKPLCTPAPYRTDAAGLVYDLPDGPPPFPIDIAFTATASMDGRIHAAALAKGHQGIALHDAATSPDAALLAGLAGPRPASVDALDDLPLEELPVARPGDIFAVLYSGDGGWRDLDKDLAAILQKQGLPVVGVDSLRYFWKRRTPERTAADLDRIIRAYQRKWGTQKVVLIGFSFGADILPSAVNRLSPEVRDFVVQISMLAFSAVADFEVTVGSWLDRKSEASLPSLPEARRLDPGRVQCFYGSDDAGTACERLEGTGVEVIRTTGGHHFDGNYPALARRILDGIARRKGGYAAPAS